MQHTRRLAPWLLLVALAAPLAAAAQPRPIVVISDVHMGVGRLAEGRWDPKEDFRWSGALRGFLDEVARRNGNRTDLVIAGDFMELWQPPADIRCTGDGADLGCTIGEAKEIVRRVVAAHKDDLAALAAFAKRGDNRVHVVPGNHDSTLVIPGVWELVADAMDAAGRVALVADGVWTSADGQVVIEHGQQIGRDVNRYENWPTVTVRKDGAEFVIRPWGELFVQKLFNAEEEQYPIIDNLSPETAGARYRMADRGLWRSVGDLARFIAFNVLETSARQKGAALGRKPEEAAPCTAAEARVLKHRLVLGTLPKDDPFRVQAEVRTPEAEALRRELDRTVEQMPDEDLRDLCARLLDTQELGAAIEARFVPRVEVIRKHLRERLAPHPKASVFVYGHTHQLEEAWQVKIDKDRTVTVLNTGAFQRVIDEDGYQARVKALGLAKPEDGLKQIALEALAPCYGAVLVDYTSGFVRAETRLWLMEEGGGNGRFVSPGVRACR